MSNDPRTRELAKIHLAAKQLGMEDTVYRSLLRTVTGKSSAGAMNARERWMVLKAMEKLGWNGATQTKTPQVKRPEVARDREPLMRKIEALLTEASRPWAYADAMADRMFGVSMVKWCEPDQLWRLAAALQKDALRHGRRVK